LRIGRAEEAFAHLGWGVAYSVLAHGSVVAGLEAVRRWVDDLEALDDLDVVACVTDAAR
jgi:hypothetical protein